MAETAPFKPLLKTLLANRWNAYVLRATPALQLSDWWLTAGCIAQTVWNVNHGRPPEKGILDYDIFYYDSDVSWEAEDAVIRETAALFADLPVEVQIRNQARVPLWYREKFGVEFPPVACAADGIYRFPCRTMSVGVRTQERGLLVHAPYGIADLMAGQLVPNTFLNVSDVYAAKAKRWINEWPKLTLVPWPEQAKQETWRAVAVEADQLVELTID